MKYFEVTFTITPCSQDAQDILSALSAEAGFETFEETPTGLKAYVQQALFQQDVLNEAIATFPFSDTIITYDVQEAEDRDWNEQWEQEGFDPIVIDRRLVIHDGRHLPENINGEASPLMIEIDAHLAFGTGTHETTRMICATLLDLPLQGKKVLDCGCGTGILGICALLLGAQECAAYDIDEWSADNTRHNAVINHVDERLHVYCGDASLLGTSIQGRYDVVTANINRNILLNDMASFVSVMQPGATLILSGFYQADCRILEAQAQKSGLALCLSKNDADWACLVFQLTQ